MFVELLLPPTPIVACALWVTFNLAVLVRSYVYWVKFFVRWHTRNGQARHPRDMGAAEVQQFFSMLTTQRNVSVSTHNQALSALLFLYREVLGVQLPWLDDVQRPTRPRRIPSVLTVT